MVCWFDALYSTNVLNCFSRCSRDSHWRTSQCFSIKWKGVGVSVRNKSWWECTVAGLQICKEIYRLACCSRWTILYLYLKVIDAAFSCIQTVQKQISQININKFKIFIDKRDAQSWTNFMSVLHSMLPIRTLLLNLQSEHHCCMTSLCIWT